MNLEFEIEMTTKDLYKYNMRNAYTSMQGILSIICSALVVFVFIWKFESLSMVYKALFVVLAIAFLAYIPISLYIRSKQIVATTDVFKEPLTFIFDEEAINIKSPVATEDDETVLPWEDIYKVVKTKSLLLIYTNRVSAYIIPREQIVDKEKEIIDVLKDKVDAFKLRGL